MEIIIPQRHIRSAPSTSPINLLRVMQIFSILATPVLFFLVFILASINNQDTLCYVKKTPETTRVPIPKPSTPNVEHFNTEFEAKFRRLAKDFHGPIYQKSGPAPQIDPTFVENTTPKAPVAEPPPAPVPSVGIDENTPTSISKLLEFLYRDSIEDDDSDVNLDGIDENEDLGGLDYYGDEDEEPPVISAPIQQTETYLVRKERSVGQEKTRAIRATNRRTSRRAKMATGAILKDEGLQG